MGQLDAKTALVTGGSTGIGLAVAKRFVDEGAHVFVTGRRKEELDTALEALGDRAVGIRSDIADLDDVDRLFETVGERGAGLDVVYANAGGGTFSPITEVTVEEVDSTFAINVRGTVFTVQKALPLLNEGASIILAGSSSASRGAPGSGVYSASKAAIRQFGRVWAAELAPRGIRVNTIVPGPTDTPGLRGIASDPDAVPTLLESMADQTALGRVAAPAEIANAVLFLATDQSSFVTGSELFVDGGEVQVHP